MLGLKTCTTTTWLISDCLKRFYFSFVEFVSARVCQYPWMLEDIRLLELELEGIGSHLTWVLEADQVLWKSSMILPADPSLESLTASSLHTSYACVHAHVHPNTHGRDHLSYLLIK